MLALYSCPICQQPLLFDNRVYRCIQNHCFDAAKEGYVNLLPVQYKHSKEPGDNKQMVKARRAFLEKGYYAPLIKAILAFKQKYIMHTTASSILDAGCGEGYYTHQHQSDINQTYGVDIAKEAIKIAAKKYKSCNFSVGTLSQLPFSDGFFDWVYSIYAPILEQEFTRVLKPAGYLLTVTPATNHLLELKAIIYREATPHDIDKQPIKSLLLIEEMRVNYTMEFTEIADILNLLSMTPFAFKASADALQKIKSLKSFSCQADFLIRVYQKPE